MFNFLTQHKDIAVFTNGKYDVFFSGDLRLAYRIHREDVSEDIGGVKLGINLQISILQGI